MMISKFLRAYVCINEFLHTCISCLITFQIKDIVRNSYNPKWAINNIDENDQVLAKIY